MEHVREGVLRAYCDGAMGEKDRERVRAHLAHCSRCAQKASAVQERGAHIGSLLAGMDSHPTRVPVSTQTARHRLTDYVERRKEHTMLQNVFARRYRAAWVAVALVLALAIAFSFAPVRALAGDLLGLFRVRRIEFVEVDPAQLTGEESLEVVARKLETMLDDQVRIESEGEPQLVDEATARSLSAFPVRLPTVLGEETRIAVRPGMRAGVEIDLPRIRAFLSELGYDDLELPDSLDGAEIDIGFSTAVVAAYGACEPGSEEWSMAQDVTDFDGDCTVLIQMPSPSVEAPPELDIEQLGRAYLQLLGMSPEEALHFSERVDWTTTLVVPIPRSMALDYADVYVDGVVGTLIRSPQHGEEEQEYVLTWVKGDVVYALSGRGAGQDAVQIAESLQ